MFHLDAKILMLQIDQAPGQQARAYQQNHR